MTQFVVTVQLFQDQQNLGTRSLGVKKVKEWVMITLVSYLNFLLWMKRGHILNLTSSGKANIADPTNSEIENNHMGWSEHKNF